MEFGLLSTFFVWVFAAYDGRLKMRERKMRHNVAGLEIAGNCTMEYGKPKKLFRVLTNIIFKNHNIIRIMSPQERSVSGTYIKKGKVR